MCKFSHSSNWGTDSCTQNQETSVKGKIPFCLVFGCQFFCRNCSWGGMYFPAPSPINYILCSVTLCLRAMQQLFLPQPHNVGCRHKPARFHKALVLCLDSWRNGEGLYIGGNQTKTKQETKSPKVFLSFDNEIKGSESEFTLLVSINLQGSRRKGNGAVNVYKQSTVAQVVNTCYNASRSR